MKKLLLLTSCMILGILLTKCAVDKNLLTETERVDFSSKNDTIMFKNRPVAVFTHYEVELYKGEVTNELCLSALYIDTSNIEPLIIKYVHTVHPNVKVQFRPKYK